MSKHIVNNKEDWANEALEGYLHFNNESLISLKEYPNVVVRRDYEILKEGEGRVAIISGGGSGHEPAHVGFIGQGMLTAVVCGNLFASPSTSAILAAIKFVGRSNKAGVLMIVKNYTGDRLNFGIAAKRAQLEGINVEWVLVDDDVALINSENRKESSVGERGLCGTIFIHKIAGALAEQQKSLKEIKEILDRILKNNLLRTLGVSLSGRVQLPGESQKVTQDSNLDIEIGLGIHGEAGRRKIKLPKSNELIKLIFEDYLLDFDQGKETRKNLCLMINNLGGLSNLEMYLLVNDSFKYISQYQTGIQVKRAYCDSLMTSLNMNGFSITLLLLENENSDFILNLLDSKTMAPSWPKTYGKNLSQLNYVSTDFKHETIAYAQDLRNISLKAENARIFERVLKNVSQHLIKSTDILNKLDSECGDGDCGSSLSKIAEVILKDINESKFDFQFPHKVIINLSNILENGGGSLSILLSLFASAAARAFASDSIGILSEEDPLYWIKIWKNFVDYGLSAVEEYGRAKPNQRSIVDPLNEIQVYFKKFLETIDSSQFEITNFLKTLAEVTQKSAESTARMKPKVGRASYVDASIIKSPDAGATAISIIISSIAESF